MHAEATQAPERPRRYTAVAALACSDCGSHEIDYVSPVDGRCAECGGAAEPDFYQLHGCVIPRAAA